MIYPKLYHYRGRFERWGKDGSDKDFILKLMRHIPPSRQQEVSDQYERLFTGEGRKAANEYLHAEAKVYRDKWRAKQDAISRPRR